jgi:predicted RNA-binding protein (virulence factor B family)
MLRAGQYYTLPILRIKEAGAYLDDGEKGILLPGKHVPPNAKPGDELHVFIYHDSEDRIIATTETPKAQSSEIVRLKVVGLSRFGAFLDWGLPKDLFIPASAMRSPFRMGGEYLVYITVDPKSGRLMATQYFDHVLGNESLTVKEKDAVHLTVYRKTDIGYVMIIDHKHLGILHFNEIYTNLEIGDSLDGYIVKIRPDNKIDLRLGKPGFIRTDEEAERILQLLHDKGGYLPYHDKSDPEEIYAVFSMSKKAFKMAIGRLYKEKKIELTGTGFKLL